METQQPEDRSLYRWRDGLVAPLMAAAIVLAAAFAMGDSVGGARRPPSWAQEVRAAAAAAAGASILTMGLLRSRSGRSIALAACAGAMLGLGGLLWFGGRVSTGSGARQGEGILEQLLSEEGLAIPAVIAGPRSAGRGGSGGGVVRLRPGGAGEVHALELEASGGVLSVELTRLGDDLLGGWELGGGLDGHFVYRNRVRWDGDPAGQGPAEELLGRWYELVVIPERASRSGTSAGGL